MWTFQMDLVAAFCVSAIIMFIASLGLMMLVVYLRRPKPEPVQNQGQASDIVYVPTTVQSSTPNYPDQCPDVAKPLLNGEAIVPSAPPAALMYPSKELEALREDC